MKDFENQQQRAKSDEQRARRQEPRFKALFFVPCSIYILLLCSLLPLACGRKAPPQLKSFEKPERVKNLKAFHNERGLVITWTYPEKRKKEIKGFIILRSEGRDFEKKGYTEVKDAIFIDSDFRTDRHYRYRVIAEGIKGILSDVTEIPVTPARLPDPPKNIRFHIRNDSIKLIWDKNNGCYNIYRAYEEEEYSLINNNRPICDNIFIDRVSIERPVYYVIRSIVTTDIINEGPPSEKVTIDLKDYIPSHPEGLRITIGDKKVFLIWKESPEVWVKGYRIYRRSEGEKDFQLIGETSIPGFTDSNLNSLEGKKIFYMIRAFGPSAESAPLNGDCLLRYP